MRSETCRGERILYDFNVFFNKYVHELVTTDTDFIDARFNYETSCNIFHVWKLTYMRLLSLSH